MPAFAAEIQECRDSGADDHFGEAFRQASTHHNFTAFAVVEGLQADLAGAERLAILAEEIDPQPTQVDGLSGEEVLPAGAAFRRGGLDGLVPPRAAFQPEDEGVARGFDAGEFDFDAAFKPGLARIQTPTEMLLLEAMRRIDESSLRPI